MTKRTTDQWEDLIDPDLSEGVWVEEPDRDDEDWHVCFQDPYWGFRGTLGSAHDEKLAKLFAASNEAVAEVVRLRRALEDLRDHYRTRSYPYGEVARDLTRILEGVNDE